MQYRQIDHFSGNCFEIQFTIKYNNLNLLQVFNRDCNEINFMRENEKQPANKTTSTFNYARYIRIVLYTLALISNENLLHIVVFI